MKVLVIPNSPVICEKLLVLLAESGHYEGLGCVTGATTALDLVRAYEPDVLLLDLHLKFGGSGFKVLESLRRRQDELPDILLSGSDDLQWRQQPQAVSAAALLSKSSQFDQILPTLDGLCESKCAAMAAGELRP